MNAIAEDIDRALFEIHRAQLEKHNGYAQSEDALVSQAQKILASESVCRIVIPYQGNMSKALLPHLARLGSSLKTENHSIYIKGSPSISYSIVTLRQLTRR